MSWWHGVWFWSGSGLVEVGLASATSNPTEGAGGIKVGIFVGLKH